MPFWKQSEDPWDQKPKKPHPPKEPKGELLDSLKAWNEDRKAAAKEKEEAKWLPPEKCPWCGKEMEQGYMMGGRGFLRWYSGVLTTKAALIGDSSKETIDLATEGALTMYKTTWLCRECGKMVLDVPEPERVYDFPEPQDAGTEETKEEEESES